MSTVKPAPKPANESGRSVSTNPGSDAQIAQGLTQTGMRLPLTDAGNPSVAADVLAPLRHKPGTVGELVGAVLDYREHDTVITTFLDPYDALVRYDDGRVRPTVYTLGARTGRMACVRPNLQNVPRTGGVRGCITAAPGYVLVSADFAGIELRVAAALSGDANLHRLIVGMTMTELAARSGVSLPTVRELVHVLSTRRRQPRTLAAISNALGWPDDHLGMVLRGKVLAVPPDPGELPDLAARVRAVEERLSEIERRLPG